MQKKKYKKSQFNVYFKEGGNVYLYNSLTGAFVLLEKEYEEFYEKEELWKEDKKKLEEFIKGGFIVDHELDEERYYYLKVIDALWRSKDTYSFTILTTTACNFACSYCYEAQFGVKPVYMDRATQDVVIRFIEKRIKARKKKGLNIVFYGGEPLLNKEAIFYTGSKLKEISSQLDMEFTAEIVTNGYLLSPQIAERLYNEINLRKAQITIDGPSKVHNRMRPLKGGGKTFSVIVNNIRGVLDRIEGFLIHCRTNLNKNNYAYYEELLEYMEKEVRREVKYPHNLVCYPYFVSGEREAPFGIRDKSLFTPEEFGKLYGEYLLPLLLKYGHISPEKIIPEPRFSLCMAPSPDSLLIEPDGTLQKCWDIVGTKRYAVGDVYTGINVARETLWLSYEFWDNRCKQCNMLPVCGGGCAKSVIVDKERMCDFRKFAIKDILKLAAESAGNL